ncbi:MAG: GTPase ObgE [Microgenomates group bacterium]
MTDLAKLLITAGKGGDGRVSFRREKYVPKGGPDGGRGGNGGDVVVRGNSALATLHLYAGRDHFVAEDGQFGGPKKKIGKLGTSTILEVPLGTRVWLIAENEVAKKRRTRLGWLEKLRPSDVEQVIYEREKNGRVTPKAPTDTRWFLPNGTELTESQFEELSKTRASSLLRENKSRFDSFEITADGEEVILAQGGFSGRGNESFKGPDRTTPVIAEYGSPPEKRFVLFELRLLADIGLVGFPNAGKSTLLSVVTNARPKVASYPFTTIEPHLGIMTLSEDSHDEVVIADIPGLIHGASEGKGLGHEFLRHVEHCAALLYVLFLEESRIFESTATHEELAEQLWQQFQDLQKEVRDHSTDLVEKKVLVSLNKIDIYPKELVSAVEAFFAQKGVRLLPFSGATKVGLDSIRQEIREIVSQE